MNRRFVIGVEGLTRDQESRLREFLAENGAWWHWIDNFWLFSSTRDDTNFSVRTIIDRIREINKDARAAIFEFPEDVDWATRGKPSSGGKKMSDWLKDTWERE